MSKYVLKEKKLKAYKIHCLLLEDDPDCCTEFTETMVTISDEPLCMKEFHTQQTFSQEVP